MTCDMETLYHMLICHLYIFFLKEVFIYLLAALGLLVAHRVFDLCCGMWDL